MNRDEVWQMIDDERLGLADFFDDLSAQEWETASLCAGWRVRDVAAHLTLAHMGPVPATLAMLRARGNLNRMIHDTAVRQARLPAGQYAVMAFTRPTQAERTPAGRHRRPVVGRTGPAGRGTDRGDLAAAHRPANGPAAPVRPRGCRSLLSAGYRGLTAWWRGCIEQPDTAAPRRPGPEPPFLP